MEDIEIEDYEYEYSQANTWDLLKTLSYVRADLTRYDYISNTDDDKSRLLKIYDALKTELATREHIPNKEERKKERQEKFKLKKT